MNPAEFLPTLEATARAAGAVHMKHFRQLKGLEKKSAIDLLTIADKESEAVIADCIRTAYGSHRLLMEESGAIGGAASPEYTWVVDPLDGTTNYAHGLRIFATSIGVLHEGRPVAGAIYAAALDEMYLVARGHGAWRNGERIHVSRAATLDDALLVTGFPYDRRKVLEPLMSMMHAALERSRGVLRLGAAALDLAAVASGHLDAFYEYHLHPWDVAAGMLLVEEAGGRVTNFAGEVYDPLSPHTTVASNGLIHAEVIAHVTGPKAREFPPHRFYS